MLDGNTATEAGDEVLQPAQAEAAQPTQNCVAAQANSSEEVSSQTKTSANSAELIRSTQRLADAIAARPNLGEILAPLEDLRSLAELGLMTAPLPKAYGGLGLGTEPGGHAALLRLLAAVGGAGLALGRLYEGHVNALILIAAFGTEAQIRRAATDAFAGRWFGVWNTGDPDLLQLRCFGNSYAFRGGKTFASGVAFVTRPVITAQLDGGGWQMTLPRMESPEVAGAMRIDRSFWHPLGMEASESFAVDLTGAAITQDDLLGAPEDFYRDPLFRGGAIRFAAVQAGAVLRLHRLFAEWLRTGRREEDPYQIARLGEVTIHAQQAVLWIERAAAAAEDGLALTANKLAAERMVECANMTRLAIERIATAVMPQIIAGVGAHGLLQPSRFERILRDLTMYLRQPGPDRTLADVGRATLRKMDLQADGAEAGLWRDAAGGGSLPASYFESVYAASVDPWKFETSEYEARKYETTLRHLPRSRYRRALEVGCSIGVLTARLAERCDSLLSVDVSERALEIARDRCRSQPQVQIARLSIPEEMPEGAFDLVVISEVGYYWQREDLDRTATLLAERQPPGSDLILVHYTPHVPDYPLTGDQVHEAWLARPEWLSIQSLRGEEYRLDVLRRQA